MRKALIVGFAPDWNDYPKDYEGEVWSLNMGGVMCERIDTLFLADKLEDKTSIKDGYYVPIFGDDKGKKVKIDEEKYKKIIAERGIKVISCHPYDIPNLETYPIKEVVETFGSDYFANTICYMIAYAILKGYEEIELWGVRQGLMTEYMFHKGCIEFWIGMAVGHGVNVRIMGDSLVLRTPDGRLYGYKKTIEELLNKE